MLVYMCESVCVRVQVPNFFFILFLDIIKEGRVYYIKKQRRVVYKYLRTN